MRIKKVLNQNAVVVSADADHQERIALGKGIGFNKKKNDLLPSREVERFFILEPENQQRLLNLLQQIDEKFFFAAEHIMLHAETVLMEKLNGHLLVALTDHISFAAENIANGIIIKNKLLSEIEVLYSEEFSIAQWGVDYLNEELGIAYGYDEAGYIAMHIHSARAGHSNNSRSIREVTIISDIIFLIEEELEINLHDDAMNLHYSRLANHLRLLLQRFQKNQYAVLDEDILAMVKKKYAASYETAKKIRVLLLKNYQISVTPEELGYLAIHIERLRFNTTHAATTTTEDCKKGENLEK